MSVFYIHENISNNLILYIILNYNEHIIKHFKNVIYIDSLIQLISIFPMVNR